MTIVRCPWLSLETKSPRSAVRYSNNGPRTTDDRLPSEVRECLVRLGHLDGVLALGHGFALAPVGGHEFVGEAQEHRPARLGAGSAEYPADGQALLAFAIHLHRHLIRSPADALRAHLDGRLDGLDGLR